ncbi:MAG TPA: orotidine-5'-phosphate decarboxylase [Firmicutes bacterium]|uniref:Orotidine 5'-phosphate decarboxylase n=1 Tax=candidate division TA06 bacterium TaxID=2250710 RepID=A0A660S848_UNCT6|nr:orotidine-5'-phosphate decarboxylase [candidate division WOR-3 bacterium]RKX66454.1 MAG: orotidine-5'-phosphate decarboxylase [candidate division TA06 bacterium]HFD04626.1 orotidine-5'-phosphate decarboxylase [Bacillota bacterium]
MNERLIVALDVHNIDTARNILDELDGIVSFYKIGMQLFTKFGPDIVEEVKRRGNRVFLDLKFHDIPNTVANAVYSAVDIGVDLLTIHTLGGFEMMEQAMKAALDGEDKKLRIVGVTMLTSLSDAFLKDILQVYDKSINDMVLILAKAAKSAGLDGVVASSFETRKIKEACGSNFLVVTPGIRPIGNDPFDQVRVATPEQAIKNGSDYLVVGRPIIKADDRAKAAMDIVEQMKRGAE